MSGAGLALTVTLAPSWEAADACRSTVERLLRLVLAAPEAAEPLAMAASELVENAVKYGEFGGEAALIVVAVDAAEARVVVDVASPCAEGSSHLSRLRETLPRLQTPDGARTTYMARVQEIARGPGDGSRMGLLRIVVEAGAVLEAERASDGLLHVRATWQRS